MAQFRLGPAGMEKTGEEGAQTQMQRWRKHSRVEVNRGLDDHDCRKSRSLCVSVRLGTAPAAWRRWRRNKERKTAPAYCPGGQLAVTPGHRLGDGAPSTQLNRPSGCHDGMHRLQGRDLPDK